MKRLLLLSLFISISGICDAQLSIQGQIRPRTEFRNGFKKPTLNGDDPAVFTEQRSRLTLNHKSDKFDTKISVQDVRIWGESGQINKTDGLLSVHEAFTRYKFSDRASIKIGRQEFIYDDHRVIGNLDWAAQGRSHDAIRYIIEDSTWTLHLAATWNQDNSPAEPAKLQGPGATSFTSAGGAYSNAQINTVFQLPNPKSLQILWFSKKFKSGNVNFIGINDGIQTTDSTVHWRQTVGIIPTLKFGDIKFFGSLYYQLGKSSDSVDYGGLLASAQFTYTGSKKFTPTIGFDYVSGDDKSTSNKIEGFDPLYGTPHKFYGYMDYFYVGNGHNGGGNALSGGLMDIYLKSKISVGKAKLVAAAHYFMSPTEVLSTVDASVASNGLGMEIDLVYVRPITQGVLLKVGYSQMMATESMNFIKGQLPADNNGFNGWGWVMINFTPKLL